MGMPILEHILRGGRVTNGRHPDMAKQVQDGIKRSAFFDIQVADDIATERLHEGFRVDENIGLLHAPFPDVFMEWDGIFGCHLTEQGPSLGNMVATLILSHDGEIVAYPFQRLICLDKASQFQEWGILSDGEPEDYDIQVSNQLLFTVITALALINCRNVTTQDTGRISIGRSGTQKRRRQPPQDIRYNTIILPGAGTGSGGKGGHRATALHRVRGHFKTFTADKPLLGKHTGMFWWGWQVRGDSDHGTIVSDYQLAGQL